jgi:uncharacterized protein (DUF433 family)
MNSIVKIGRDGVSGIGLYTVPMVAKLLGERPRVVQSWLEGYVNSDAEPIIKRQLPQIDGKTVFGFLDLVEAKFVKHFCDLGLSPQSIRRVANKLRQKHNEDHPFATDKRFRTDGRKIFLEVAETDEERRIIDVMSENFVMASVIDQSLFDSILYAKDLAYRWQPNPQLPLIVLDPKIAFGKPVIKDVWTPTHTIYSTFKVEGSEEVVAEEFNLQMDAVKQAVAFERSLVETLH